MAFSPAIVGKAAGDRDPASEERVKHRDRGHYGRGFVAVSIDIEGATIRDIGEGRRIPCHLNHPFFLAADLLVGLTQVSSSVSQIIWLSMELRRN
jgi:hypothetical protein